MTDTSRKILLVQVGTPPDEIRGEHGDLPVWFGRALDVPADQVEVVRVFDGEALPPPDPERVAIITGSWSMVTERLPWSEAAAAWVRDAVAADMPLFGVCYGHQLMAYALGGTVEYHPRGREMGCHPVHLTAEADADPLLAGMPPRFAAHLTHMQTVTALPPGASVLAASDHDPHQIVRYGRNAVSVQFHPEFTQEVMRGIIAFRAGVLQEEGIDPDILLAEVSDAPEPLALLRRFVHRSLDRDEANVAKAA